MRYSEFKILEQEVEKPKNPTQDTEPAGLAAGPPYPPDQRQTVMALQSRLEQLGYSVGNTGIDGKYGPRTTRAVRAFKKDFGVPGNATAMSDTDLKTLQSAQKLEKPSPTGNESQMSAIGNVKWDDPNYTAPGYPSDLSRGEIEKMIRKEADLRGIDPDVAVAIFRSEGAGAYQSMVRRQGRGALGGREASFGPYQLFIGGGLGNTYQQKTGKDLTKDNTREGILNQIRFALDMAAKQSWQPWYGRKTAGVGRWQGLEGAKQIGNWS